MTAEQKTQRKARTMGSLWMVLLTVFMFCIFRWSPEMISAVAQIPIDQIGDTGPEAIQRPMMAMFSVTWGILFSTIMASFVENQLKPEAFGNTSRWAVLFVTFFLGFCLVVT